MNGHERDAATDSPDLRIAQDSRMKSEGWWDWWVWIEGSDADLDRVEKVTWHLHPSFPQPVIVSRERGDKFRLGTSGWGEFTLRAQLLLRDGGERTLEHRLHLFGDDPPRSAPRRGAVVDRPLSADAEAPPPPRRRRRVFISHSLADAPVARALRERLRDEDVEVVLPDDLGQPGESGGEAIARSISDSDLVVAVSSPLAGEYVDIETDLARKKGKPVFRLQLEDPEAEEAAPEATEQRADAGPELTLSLDRSSLKSAAEPALGDAWGHILQSLHRFSDET